MHGPSHHHHGVYVSPRMLSAFIACLDGLLLLGIELQQSLICWSIMHSLTACLHSMLSNKLAIQGVDTCPFARDCIHISLGHH